MAASAAVVSCGCVMFYCSCFFLFQREMFESVCRLPWNIATWVGGVV